MSGSEPAEVNAIFNFFWKGANRYLEIHRFAGADRPRRARNERHLSLLCLRPALRLARNNGLTRLGSERFRGDLATEIAVDTRIVNEEVSSYVAP